MTTRVMRARSAWGAAVSLIVLAGLAGCGGSGGTKPVSVGTSAPVTAGSASSTPSLSPSEAAEQQVVAQYKKLLPAIHRAYGMSATKRRALLSTVEVNPALSSSIKGIKKDLDAGKVAWGEGLLYQDPKVEMKKYAVVTDCVDSSHGGLADAKSGKHLTVGPAKDPLEVQFKRVDGVWKASFIGTPKACE